MATATTLTAPEVTAPLRRARVINFDLETIFTRNPEVSEKVQQDAINKQYSQNTKKELKITWDSEQSQMARAREALLKTAVDVLVAEVLCCSYLADGKPDTIDMMECSEKEGLHQLSVDWDDLAGPETIWVGHNIENFDLPILLNRWRAHGIRPPHHFPVFNRGRWRGRVFDTMQRTPCQNGLGYVSLTDVSRAYGLPPAKSREWNGHPMDGSRVADAFEAGEFQLIREYCMDDVEAQEALYQIMTCSDTWGTFLDRDDVAIQVSQIEASELPAGQKALSILRLLDGVGLIPRQ